MRWPWRRNTVQLVGGEVRGRSAGTPLGVWADYGEGRESLTPVFKRFEGEIAVWSVELKNWPMAMGADAFPPQCAIEWSAPHDKGFGVAPWRHPDGKS